MRKDETYILDLCDDLLGAASLRQYRGFDFLQGDKGHPLPVDAFYPDRRLVIEYHEVQHTSAVPMMDKRITASGVSRGEQRKLYDERRRKLLPEHGMSLVVLDYMMFELTSGKDCGEILRWTEPSFGRS
jgi:hypothetical protein